MKPIYPDNNATARLDPMVLDAMIPFLIDSYGNPPSTHDFGLPTQAALEQAHQQVAALLGADYPSEVIPASYAVGAIIIAIASAVALMPEWREIITSAVEHPTTLTVCEQLECQGYLIHYIVVDQQDAPDMAQFRAALSLHVALVSIMWTNNEIGIMFPVPELTELAHKQGALFHCDVIQVVGRTPMTLSQARIDMLFHSTHKFHGPKRVGYLWLRHGTRFRPLLRGGHQTHDRWAGMESISDAVGMDVANELVQVHLPGMAQISQPRDRLE